MSGITITFAIITLISLSMIGIYVLQARERARIEKIQKINNFTYRYQRLERLLQELPPQYLTDELRQMIAQEIDDTLTKLVEIHPSKQGNDALAASKDYLKQLQNKTLDIKPVPVRDLQQVKEVCGLLKVLYHFVQQRLKLKQLDIPRATQYLTQISFASSRAQADLFVSRALKAIRESKPRSAIHAYHKAIEAYKTLPSHPKALQAVTSYREQIRALEQAADQHNQEAKFKAQSKMDDNEEWSEFLTDDEKWKKKNSYDD